MIDVADPTHTKLVPAAQRAHDAFTAAGAMVQNAYLFCAANALGTVVRAWFDHAALSAAMGLQTDQQLLVCQTVGRSKEPG